MATPELAYEYYWQVSSREELEKQIAEIAFPCEFKMPCGTKISFAENMEFPRATMSCPCGNPLHFSVIIELVP